MHLEEEAARCLLCVNAPCSQACKNGDPARAIRAIRFGNQRLASQWVDKCTDEDLENAEQACIHYDRPIRIKEMLRSLVKAIYSKKHVKVIDWRYAILTKCWRLIPNFIWRHIKLYR